MERFSFGGPNDSFNKRRQRTWTIGDTLSWNLASHALRIGGEVRRNEFDTNLPEEQATEFEKFDNFTQLLRGLATEGDTQFGITDKQFRFNDFNMFVADEWRLIADADAEPRRALRVLRPAGGSQRPDRQRRLRGAHEHREPGQRLHRPEERADDRLRGHRRGDRHVDEGVEQSHAERAGLEQRRAAARIRLDAEPAVGRARRLRRVLRSPVGGLHQHGLQQLSVPARAGGDVPGQRRADERGLVAAGSDSSRSTSTCRTASCARPARPARIRSATART